MNREIIELREVVTKLVPMLTGKGLTVTQRGVSAYVVADPKTRKPTRLNIPNIPDNADPQFIRAIQGFIDHEVGHVLITDWDWICGYKVSPAKMAERKTQRLRNYHNIIEDTMIEREMERIFPGSKKNIADLRRHFIAKITKPAVAAAKDDKEKFLYLLVVIMRALAGHREFSQYMDEDKIWDLPFVKKFIEMLPQKMLKDLPKVKTTKETYELAQMLDEVLHPIVPPPQINSVNPNQSFTQGGEPIAIDGENFIDLEYVKFDGKLAKILAHQSSKQIVVQSPAHPAGTVDVEIKTEHGTTVKGNAFEYVEPPPAPGGGDGEPDDSAGDSNDQQDQQPSDGESQDKPDKKAEQGDGDGERDHSESKADEDGEKDEGKEEADGADDGDSAESGEEGSEQSKPSASDKSDGAEENGADEEMGGEPAGDEPGSDDAEDAGDRDSDEESAPDADPEQDQGNENGDEPSEDETVEQPENGTDGDDGSDEDQEDGQGEADDDGDADEAEGDKNGDPETGDDDGENAGDQDEEDSDTHGSGAEAEEDEDGEQGDESPVEEGSDRLAIQTDDHEAGEVGEAEDSDSEGGGVGNGLGKGLFDFDDDAFDQADMSSQMTVLIVNEAVDLLGQNDYNVFTREFDRIEKLNAPDIDPSWIPALEDQTRAMTGRMQKDIERMMASQSHVVKIPGFRSGRLHAPSLHRIMSNDDRLFNRKQEHKSKDTAVTLLIDNSGSMNGAKIVTAMIAAYALSQTLERVNIANEVLGFTTGDHSGRGSRTARSDMNKELSDAAMRGVQFHRVVPIMMPIYKEFDERINSEVKKRIAYMANAQRGMVTNVDGESLEYAAIRLLKRREKRKVMLVLSDGQPSGAANAAGHLKQTVEKLEKLGIDLVGIGIMDGAVRRFYKNHVVLSRIEDLPTEVMSELKTILSA